MIGQTTKFVTSIRLRATLDWRCRASVQAATRTKVRWLPANYDNPPNLEAKAFHLVLGQEQFDASVAGGAFA